MAVPGAQAQRGALTAQENLVGLVERAHTIVRGQVASARVEPHPEFANLHTVLVTLRVRETLKGETGQTFTFRQYIWDIRDRYDAAGYRKGGELLLLMTKPSQYGLSSPIGLEQGRFRIVRDREGNELAVNGAGNAGLFRNLDADLQRKGVRLRSDLAVIVQQHRHGPLPLEQLRDLIQQFAGAN